MEEAKAAAYYDELTRKGQGAARFKQGLGFSSNSTTDGAVPPRGSALPSSSSPFLSKFVRASSPSKASELEKQAQLESIQNKLKKKPKPTSSETIKKTSTDRTKEKDRYRDQHSRLRSLSHSRSPSRDRDRHSRRRSRSQSRDRDIHSRRRSRDGYRSRRRHRHPSRSTSRDGDRDRRRDRDRKRRSRSRTVSDEDRGRRRESRSASPREAMSEKSRGDSDKVAKERNDGTDYSKLIEGYDTMAPAERVKAKMKLQLSETAEKDEAKGSGWERFEFNRHVPVDDEDIEAVEDDTALVKHLGQSFRFSAMKAKRDEKIKAAHDEAIFGALTHLSSNSLDDEEKNDYKRESTETDPVTNLISEQVLARQHGSWRERARQV